MFSESFSFQHFLKIDKSYKRIKVTGSCGRKVSAKEVSAKEVSAKEVSAKEEMILNGKVNCFMNWLRVICIAIPAAFVWYLICMLEGAVYR